MPTTTNMRSDHDILRARPRAQANGQARRIDDSRDAALVVSGRRCETRDIGGSVELLYTTSRHFACSVLKSEFRRRMASFGWMMAILSLIFDANASARGSTVSRMSSEGTDITLDLHLRFVRNPRNRKFVGRQQRPPCSLGAPR